MAMGAGRHGLPLALHDAVLGNFGIERDGVTAERAIQLDNTSGEILHHHSVRHASIRITPASSPQLFGVPQCANLLRVAARAIGARWSEDAIKKLNSLAE